MKNNMSEKTAGEGISRKGRIRGSLLCGAAGDALGYPVEFLGAERARIREYILDKKTGKALISDDTQMTLFTACGVLVSQTHDYISENPQAPWYFIARAYADWMKTQEPDYENGMPVSWIRDIPELNAWRAPGGTCLSALGNGPEGCGSVDKPVNNSKGCGGVMRIAPAALFGGGAGGWNQERNAWVCAEAAALTHGHPLGWLSGAALGNILYDIMQNYSLAYAVEDTVLFLEKKYGNYAYTNQMTALLRRTQALADAARTSSAADLISEFHVMKELGKGWVGEEALAVGLFCVLACAERGVDLCLWNAVGHEGDSDSTGSIAGQIWGAYFGEQSIPEKWLRDLELRAVITEIADDLAEGCKDRIDEYGRCTDPAWAGKYIL